MTTSKINNECITIEEMLDFSAINKLDESSMALIAKINSHVGKCAECRKQLKAVQGIEMAFGELYAKPSKEARLVLEAEQHADF